MAFGGARNAESRALTAERKHNAGGVSEPPAPSARGHIETGHFRSSDTNVHLMDKRGGRFFWSVKSRPAFMNRERKASKNNIVRGLLKVTA